MHMMYYYGNYGFGPEHFFSGILMVCFWVAVAFLIVWAIRGGRHTHGQCGHCKDSENGALEILKERYAKGEINKDEFDTKKKDLEG